MAKNNKLSPERRAELVTATRDAAAAMVEDLEYVRDMITRVELTAADVRRMSVILRRLLVDQDLHRVAAPRTGVPTISAPDNNEIVQAGGEEGYQIFVSGGATLFGEHFLRAWHLTIGDPEDKLFAKPPPRANVDGMVELPLESFCRQKVLCFNGQWFTRHQIVKHVANVAGGAHSGKPTQPEDVALARMRHAFRFTKEPTGIGFNMHLDQFIGVEELGPVSSEGFDPVMFELLSTAHFLLASGEVEALCEAISASTQQVGS